MTGIIVYKMEKVVACLSLFVAVFVGICQGYGVHIKSEPKANASLPLVIWHGMGKLACIRIII